MEYRFQLHKQPCTSNIENAQAQWSRRRSDITASLGRHAQGDVVAARPYRHSPSIQQFEQAGTDCRENVKPALATLSSEECKHLEWAIQSRVLLIESSKLNDHGPLSPGSCCVIDRVTLPYSTEIDMSSPTALERITDILSEERGKAYSTAEEKSALTNAVGEFLSLKSRNLNLLTRCTPSQSAMREFSAKRKADELSDKDTEAKSLFPDHVSAIQKHGKVKRIRASEKFTTGDATQQLLNILQGIAVNKSVASMTINGKQFTGGQVYGLQTKFKQLQVKNQSLPGLEALLGKERASARFTIGDATHELLKILQGPPVNQKNPGMWINGKEFTGGQVYFLQVKFKKLALRNRSLVGLKALLGKASEKFTTDDATQQLLKIMQGHTVNQMVPGMRINGKEFTGPQVYGLQARFKQLSVADQSLLGLEALLGKEKASARFTTGDATEELLKILQGTTANQTVPWMTINGKKFTGRQVNFLQAKFKQLPVGDQSLLGLEALLGKEKASARFTTGDATQQLLNIMQGPPVNLIVPDMTINNKKFTGPQVHFLQAIFKKLPVKDQSLIGLATLLGKASEKFTTDDATQELLNILQGAIVNQMVPRIKINGKKFTGAQVYFLQAKFRHLSVTDQSLHGLEALLGKEKTSARFTTDDATEELLKILQGTTVNQKVPGMMINNKKFNGRQVYFLQSKFKKLSVTDQSLLGLEALLGKEKTSARFTTDDATQELLNPWDTLDNDLDCNWWLEDEAFQAWVLACSLHSEVPALHDRAELVVDHTGAYL